MGQGCALAFLRLGQGLVLLPSHRASPGRWDGRQSFAGTRPAFGQAPLRGLLRRFAPKCAQAPGGRWSCRERRVHHLPCVVKGAFTTPSYRKGAFTTPEM